MRIKPLRSDLVRYLQKHGLVKKFEKQAKLFCLDFRHPSLHTEVLEPKKLGLDRKERYSYNSSCILQLIIQEILD